MIKSKETVVLHGRESDPEVKASLKKLKAQGRKVEVKSRPSFDTGFGPCGRLCHCTEVCLGNS